MYKQRVRLLAFFCAGLLACGASGYGRASDAGVYAEAGEQATHALIADYYDGAGRWRECDLASCTVANSDWGTDAATDALYLRWATTNDPGVQSILKSLIATSLAYPAPCEKRSCSYWSDTAAWDAVALARIYEATGDAQALSRAEDAYRFVTGSRAYLAGACSTVPYQEAIASGSDIKTLETLANETKSALLLYRATGDASYLRDARAQYGDARAYFLDEATQLYVVHVHDNGRSCEAEHARYLASVNGLMIWNGVELQHVTHKPGYLDDAVATADAIGEAFSDGDGIFADTGGDNDVVEPLIEGMYALAKDGDTESRDWILRNASVALGARGTDGSFARFFNGPPQAVPSIWESNGGFALEIAAAALNPSGAVSGIPSWREATIDVGSVRALPAAFTVEGSAFALAGTMNAACMKHHLLVSIDGVPISNRAGLWQNHALNERAHVVFAWQWRTVGSHTITIDSDGDSADQVAFDTYVLR